MEKALKAGKVRAIGVSNFLYDRFLDIADNVEVKPAVNQIETHVFCQNKQMVDLMAPYGTKMMAWGPLAEGKNNIFTHPVLSEIGSAHGKTAAQVALRFLLQRDVIIIPKTTHVERMEQNLAVTDFELTDAEMSAIAALDEGKGLIVDLGTVGQRLWLYDILKGFKV